MTGDWCRRRTRSSVPRMRSRIQLSAALRLKVGTLICLTSLLGCTGTTGAAERTLEAQSTKSRTVAVTEPPAPARTTDVGRTRKHRATVRGLLRSSTESPIRVPSRTYEGRAAIIWRGRAVTVPADLETYFASSRGVVGGFSGAQSRPSLMLYPWGGAAPARLWQGRTPGYVGSVVPGGGTRVWWSFVDFKGDDQVFSLGPADRLRTHSFNLGPPPEPEALRRLSVVAAIGERDVLVRGQWEVDSELSPPTYYRTSGRPADWPLDPVLDASTRGQFVAGLVAGETAPCLSVHPQDEAVALWTRCFKRRGKPAELVSAQFTSDGDQVVVLIRGGRYVGPAAVFHVGLDTLLVLDVASGDITSRIDHNFDRVALEDDSHVLFVRHGRPHVGGTDEGPYLATLVRCGFDGSCEPASPPLPANTSTGAVSVVPIG